MRPNKTLHPAAADGITHPLREAMELLMIGTSRDDKSGLARYGICRFSAL